MVSNAPNKSLKAFAALTGTVLTGAASHYCAGSACPLAPRYMSASKSSAKFISIRSVCEQYLAFKVFGFGQQEKHSSEAGVNSLWAVPSAMLCFS